MKTEIIESNAVLLGDFDPSKFDKFFFIKEELLSENEIKENSVFLPNLSNINTDEVQLSINNRQIVVVNKNAKGDGSSFVKLADFLVKLVKPSTIGLNFKFFLFLDDENIEIYTRKIFSPINSDIVNEKFKEVDSAFGYYASKNYDISRMKMEIKPNLAYSLSEKTNHFLLAFDFNFHIENFKGEEFIFEDKLNLFRKEANEIVSNV